MNQFEINGSQNPERPHKAVPLATTKIFTGYWPNSAPYRDAAVQYLYEKFYGASRNDKIAAGLNTEVSPHLTLIRRPGCNVWNTNLFNDVTGFYSFRPFMAGTGEQVYVIVDTATGVYVASVNGFKSKTLIYTKASGAGTSRFKGEGNTLYWGDGVSTKKWTWYPNWINSTAYPAGTSVLDSSLNIQQSLGYAVQVVSTSVTSNVATIAYSGAGTINSGDTVTFYGLTTTTGFNGVTVTVLTATTGSFTCAYVTADYGTTSDTGIAVDSTQGTGTSGTPTVTFSTTIQGVALDGTVGWICWGSSVQNMGIVAPTTAPTVSITSVPAKPSWAANTYYWPNPLIVDSNSTPYVWQLTTSGTTNSSVPSGLTTGSPTPLYAGGVVSASPTTVTDGTAVWTCNSLASRIASTAYSLGQVIAVSWTYVYYTYEYVCFSGNVGIQTPKGTVNFEDLPRNRAFKIINETGEHWAKLHITPVSDIDMIEFQPGKLVTPKHKMKLAGEWIDADLYYLNRTRGKYSGNVYTLEILSPNEDDHHYVLKTGDVAHNYYVGGCQTIQIPHNVTYKAFFECTTAGSTSAMITTNLSWNGALNSTTIDGGVTWTCVGSEVTRTASATAPPTGGGASNQVAGNVSNSQLVSVNTEIQDSNTKGEIPVVAGESGSSAPTWATSQGVQTIDNAGLTWTNQGTLGAANTGVWFYSYTYVNFNTNDESTGSALSQPILLPASSGVVVSGLGSSDMQVSAINIYRTPQETVGSTGGTPFRLTQIPAPVNGGSWSFTDTTPDPPNVGAILNVLITCPGYALVNGVVTNYNDPPPAGLTNFEFSAGRMWGTVGNISYYSTGPDVTSGNGNTSWSVLNFNETPGTMYKLWPTTVGMFHFTNDGLWLVQGLGTTSNPFEPVQLVDAKISIASSDAFCVNGTQALVYTSDRTYLQIDPQQGTSWLGQPVATDLIAGYDPTTTYLTYHSNGLDQLGIITNGGASWLSWEQVPAPETGYLWNPPATLNLGVTPQAIQSVETQPGIYTLLIGGVGASPLYARDSTFTTFSDHGNAYESWAAFGNIVFAHHGQMAGLIHVGADFVKVGTAPVVSVLLDEILNQPGTPAWSVIPNPVNDPPNLTASGSLYQLRYWMVETQQPIYCRTGLFKFDFGSDTVENELLCFTVFGESLTEEG